MLYTFDVLRSPLKVVPHPKPRFRHYFGGPPVGLGADLEDQLTRVLTLDLRDPKLSFLRLKGVAELPLVMDFAAGAIDYSVRRDGALRLHAARDERDPSLEMPEFPIRSARLETIPYRQYRAAVFASAVIDRSFLSAQDQAALESLGESYTQVGGSHAICRNYSPYCANPKCRGHGTMLMRSLATISQTPAPDIDMDFVPDDPALEYSFCIDCHSISGIVASD